MESAIEFAKRLINDGMDTEEQLEVLMAKFDLDRFDAERLQQYALEELQRGA